MRMALAVIAAFYVLALVIPALAAEPADIRAELEAKIEEVYAQPETRRVTESCREKSKELGADMDAFDSYLTETFPDESQRVACLAGFLLYRDGKIGEWDTSDVVDSFFNSATVEDYRQYQEKAYCSALQSDLKNYKTSLEAYYADNSAYPKIANFDLDFDGERKAFSYLGERTSIDYKPSGKYQKYTISASSDQCPSVYRSSSETLTVSETRKVKKAAKKKKRPAGDPG